MIQTDKYQTLAQNYSDSEISDYESDVSESDFQTLSLISASLIFTSLKKSDSESEFWNSDSGLKKSDSSLTRV